jgi:hypothetical protein
MLTSRSRHDHVTITHLASLLREPLYHNHNNYDKGLEKEYHDFKILLIIIFYFELDQNVELKIKKNKGEVIVTLKISQKKMNENCCLIVF